jgi:hypothetical protein
MFFGLKLIFYLESECLILPQIPSPDSPEVSGKILFYFSFKIEKIVTNSRK